MPQSVNSGYIVSNQTKTRKCLTKALKLQASGSMCEIDTNNCAVTEKDEGGCKIFLPLLDRKYKTIRVFMNDSIRDLVVPAKKTRALSVGDFNRVKIAARVKTREAHEKLVRATRQEKEGMIEEVNRKKEAIERTDALNKTNVTFKGRAGEARGRAAMNDQEKVEKESKKKQEREVQRIRIEREPEKPIYVPATGYSGQIVTHQAKREGDPERKKKETGLQSQTLMSGMCIRAKREREAMERGWRQMEKGQATSKTEASASFQRTPRDQETQKKLVREAMTLQESWESEWVRRAQREEMERVLGELEGKILWMK